MNKKVLIIEDDQINQRICIEVLEEKGVICMATETAEAGFEILKKSAYDIKPFIHSEKWDNRMVFFFSNIKKGQVYEVAYIVRAELPGKFMVKPTRMECMYEPTIQGWSAPTIIDVKRKWVPSPRSKVPS